MVTEGTVQLEKMTGQFSPDMDWYGCRDNETPLQIANRMGSSVKDLLALNRALYPDLKQNSRAGTIP